jgi:DNA-binding GntR family transcriptional regulator
MLLRHHPDYSWSTYVSDHTALLVAVEQRDPALPELVAAHLRLSRDLIARELEGEDARMKEGATPSRRRGSGRVD